MKTSWTKGLAAQKKDEMEREFKSSSLLRERLTTILNEKLRVKNAEMRNDTEYEKASWPYLQADSRGYERALYEVISLIE